MEKQKKYEKNMRIKRELSLLVSLAKQKEQSVCRRLTDQLVMERN